MIKLKILREAKGLNMKETARLLNMPYTTYVNYEKGQREPTSEVLIELADFFDTSVDYLVGRDVPLHRSMPSPSTVTAPVFTVAPDEIVMIKKFRALDSRGQAAVLNVLNYEYDSLPGEQADSPAKEA